jgi:hypothetical protein
MASIEALLAEIIKGASHICRNSDNRQLLVNLKLVQVY